MMHASRMRKIGWAMVLLVCTALYLGLHLRVNAVKSNVRLAERRIVALQQEKMLLETEFETRSNQEQLAAWNDVEFGYKAPDAHQFLAGERQLAQFGAPQQKGAPEPIMVASAAAPQEQASTFASLVATRAVAAELPKQGQASRQRAGDILSARLAQRTQKVAIETAPEAGE